MDCGKSTKRKRRTRVRGKFDLIQVGDSEQKALSILGEPDSRENEFRMGQAIGFEDAYARAKLSDSKYCFIWAKGADCVFTIGINNKGQVAAKELGGT